MPAFCTTSVDWRQPNATVAKVRKQSDFGESPETALERIATARGCPVPDTAALREWVLFTRHCRKGAAPTTVLLSTRSMPAAPALVEAAARKVGWSVHAGDEEPPANPQALRPDGLLLPLPRAATDQ